jgi:hypothetical protein
MDSVQNSIMKAEHAERARSVQERLQQSAETLTHPPGLHVPDSASSSGGGGCCASRKNAVGSFGRFGACGMLPFNYLCEHDHLWNDVSNFVSLNPDDDLRYLQQLRQAAQLRPELAPAAHRDSVSALSCPHAWQNYLAVHAMISLQALYLQRRCTRATLPQNVELVALYQRFATELAAISQESPPPADGAPSATLGSKLCQ